MYLFYFLIILLGIVSLLPRLYTNPHILQQAAESVLEFVREAVTRFDNLQPSIIQKLLNSLPSIKSISVLHVRTYLFIDLLKITWKNIKSLCSVQTAQQCPKSIYNRGPGVDFTFFQSILIEKMPTTRKIFQNKIIYY